MFLLKNILIEFLKYLLVLVNIVEKNKISSSKYRNIKKSRNKIIEILAKS